MRPWCFLNRVGAALIAMALALVTSAAMAQAPSVAAPIGGPIDAASTATPRNFSLDGDVAGPSGEPVAGLIVRAVSDSGVAYRTLSHGDGSFRFDALAAGGYRIQPASMDGSGMGAPLKVSVGATQTNRIALVLDETPATGRIVGTLSTPVADAGGFLLAFISALRELDGEVAFAGAAVVFENDAPFAIDHLLPGTYRVRIDGIVFGLPFVGGPVITEFFEDVETFEQATDVVVPSAGDSVPLAIDFGPVLDRAVSGRVVDAAGIGLNGITVSLLDATSQTPVASTITSGEGAYSFDAASRDTFLVFATDPQDQFADAWFPGVADVADATLIDLTDGDATQVDVTLQPLLDTGRIEGAITSSYGLDALTFVEVTALTLVDGEWVEVASVPADAFSGAFAIGRLPAATYRLRATVFDLAFGLPTEVFFDNAASIDTATDIVVEEAGLIEGLMFAISPPAEFAISGAVTDELGAPLAGIEVSAIEQPLNLTRAVAVTDVNGVYELAPLAPGAFGVLFRDPDAAFVAEYYIDAPAIGSATPVVIENADVGGIDAQLAAEVVLGASAGGTVTAAPDPAGFAFVVVDALRRDDTDTFVSVASVFVTGPQETVWSLDSLPAGDYIFAATSIDFTGAVRQQFFDGVATQDEATVLTLDEDGTLTGIDFNFESL